MHKSQNILALETVYPIVSPDSAVTKVARSGKINTKEGKVEKSNSKTRVKITKENYHSKKVEVLRDINSK